MREQALAARHPNDSAGGGGPTGAGGGGGGGGGGVSLAVALKQAAQRTAEEVDDEVRVACFVRVSGVEPRIECGSMHQVWACKAVVWWRGGETPGGSAVV